MGALVAPTDSRLPAVAAITLAYMAIGAADDWRSLTKRHNTGLTPRGKLLLQALSAVAFLAWAWWDQQLPSTDIALPLGWALPLGLLIWPLGLFVFLAESNATNLTEADRAILAATHEAALLLGTAFVVLLGRTFAGVALTLNVILLVALLSMLQATLTLPGIAGIVLTVGMAIDANVLINERIREELRRGLTPHAAIHAGYERAFATILDSNVTGLIAAIVLSAT